MIESANATGPAGARYKQLLAEARAALQSGRVRSDSVSEGTEDVVIGGVASILASAIGRGEGKRLERLAPDLIAFVLTPYLGADDAETLARQRT